MSAGTPYEDPIARSSRADLGGSRLTAKLNRTSTPPAIGRARELVEPALRAAVDRLADDRMRLVAGYQLGWWDAEGRSTPSAGGKAIRPTLALLGAEAVGGSPTPGIAGAVAVELVHNFSLLHDDIMDRDVERRHRPTGWVSFGEGQAILAGNAMLTAAIETLIVDGRAAERTVPFLLAAVQRLISGQSADLALELRDDAELADVVAMESGKTAALIACSVGIGALAAGATDDVVERLCAAGELVGLAFQLVDDLLGVVGDPSVTGKSASSDVRAGKRSAPVVAALNSGTAESARLRELLREGPPTSEDDVALAVSLIADAGGLSWTSAEAERLLSEATDILEGAGLPNRSAVSELQDLARYLVRRDR
jgi:geranylgeranyl diphosphate synthase type I